MRTWTTRAVRRRLAARGFELRRSAAERRSRLIASHGIDLVVDVGAAGGSFGREVRAHGYAGRIVSFEPLSESYDALASSIARDPLWEARQCALGEDAGEAVLHVAGNLDSSSLLPMLDAHLEAAPTTAEVRTETVRVSTLDAEFAGLDARAPYLKVDTQGFEGPVLRGGPRLLDAVVGLQLELSFVPLYDGGMLIDEAIAFAYDHGFRLASVEQGFAASDGRILQIDGVFFRPSE